MVVVLAVGIYSVIVDDRLHSTYTVEMSNEIAEVALEIISVIVRSVTMSRPVISLYGYRGTSVKPKVERDCKGCSRYYLRYCRRSVTMSRPVISLFGYRGTSIKPNVGRDCRCCGRDYVRYCRRSVRPLRYRYIVVWLPRNINKIKGRTSLQSLR
ncbi:hypothetical protein J6590_039955 [Homalodisca vitripennis]|nr:hypothetical protein J6590_039955 [Homalodisca vitripennis]